MNNVRGMHLAAATGLVCFCAVSVYGQSTIKVRPYVIDYDSIVVHDGVEKIVGHTTESRRGDGATHSVFYPAPTHPDTPNPKGEIVFRRVDFTDGISAMIVEEIHAKSTVRKPKADVARQNKADFFDRTGPDCSSKEGARETMEGTDTLFGYSAVRFSQLTGKDRATQEAALSRVVFWMLPDFNCVEVQDFSQVRASKTDEWKTTQGNRLTSITATEPDPALFTDWLNYDEMKPSDIVRREMALRCKDVDPCQMSNTPNGSDASYEKWHANLKEHEK